MYSEVYYAIGNSKMFRSYLLMTNYRSDPKQQNNDLVTLRTQDMDDSFCLKLRSWLMEMEARTPTSMESGLLLLLSMNLWSDGISDKEAINYIKILGPQKMFFLCSPKKCSSFEEHIKCFLIRKHKWISLLLCYRHLRYVFNMKPIEYCT